MNITFEIANETIMQALQICEACNTTFLEQIKQEILNTAFYQAKLMTGVAMLVSVIMFAVGWFLAGWYKRRSVRKND
ncbi:MAG: hypothetical protein ACTSW1_07400 [Candidatus Hodarchaeales archaeon]